jgi:hypothetical protein
VDQRREREGALGAATRLLQLLRRPWEAAQVEAAPAPDVVELARTLGLLPLVAARVRPGVSGPLTLTRLEAVAASARARAELGEVARVLAAAGVTAVAIKGPALAELAWPPATRPSCDLDLWLPRPDDYARAAAALGSLGLVPDDALPPAGGADVERVFCRPGRLAVDLQLTLMKGALRARVAHPGPEAWGPSPGSKDVLVLDAAWTLALAAVHLHQDLLSLRRVADLALLRARLAPADLARGEALAGDLGLLGVLEWGAWLATTWFDAPGPRAAPRGRTWVQRLVLPRLADLSLWTGPPTWLNGRAPLDDASILRQTLLRLALLDDAARAAPEQLLRALFPPGEYAGRRGGAARRLLALGPRLVAAVLGH